MPPAREGTRQQTGQPIPTQKYGALKYGALIAVIIPNLDFPIECTLLAFDTDSYIGINVLRRYRGSGMACPLGGETCTEATHFLRRPAEGPLEQELDALL